MIGGLEADIRSVRQDMTKLMVDVAEIKGMLTGFKMAFDQVVKRLSTTHWVMGLIVATQVVVLGKLFLK